MYLKNDSYIVTRETVSKILDALENNWFKFNGEYESNNNDIIEAENLLKSEIESQESANG